MKPTLLTVATDTTKALGRTMTDSTTNLGRKLMLAAYRSGYRAGGTVDERLVRRWMPLVVGQRLAEGIEEERVPLLRLLSRSLKEAEEAD